MKRTTLYCDDCAKKDEGCTAWRSQPASSCKSYTSNGKSWMGIEVQKPADVIRKSGHPAFFKLLDDMAELHSRKNHDYAGTSDPLKNLRACERLDLKPFMGVMVRLQDKWSRLEEFVKSNKLMVKNESVIDTLMDNAVYSLLAIILYQEQLSEEEK